MPACLVVVASLWFSFGGTVSCMHLCCLLLMGIMNLFLVVKPMLCFDYSSCLGNNAWLWNG